MIIQDIPLYKLDLTAVSGLNRVPKEYNKRTSVKNNHIFIPRYAPFYQNSLKMFKMDGTLMTEGVDYEFYGIMSKLTEYTAKPVGLYIRLLDDSITEWYSDYQVVGNFNKITDDILQMLKDLSQDDRKIHWDNIDNKPLWFVPELHQHDWTYDIFGFQDLEGILLQVAGMQKLFSNNFVLTMENFTERLTTYIAGHKKVLVDLIKSHADSTMDNHGVSKEDIDLGLVQNSRTATTEEVLAGESTVYRVQIPDAVKAAEVASGRNNRLFPAGSLPVLRYGSDSFIPPKIDGSFEGMGGLTFRAGACVEPSGLVTMLQHRNNGITRGLYFIIGSNITNKNAKWEMTGYRYIHPTATAAGANIDMIINGSNGKIMIIGDSVKNIWFWVEPKGTYDPGQHILNPLTGTWVTKYAKDNYQRSQLFVDDNYADSFFLLQGLSTTQVQAIRTDWPNATETGYGAQVYTGFTVNVLSKLQGSLVECKVDFTEQDGIRKVDQLFIPRKRKMLNGGISEYHVVFDPPVMTVWDYRGLAGQSVYNPVTKERRFKYQNIIYCVNQNNQVTANDPATWRGSIKFIGSGIDFTAKIDWAPGDNILQTYKTLLPSNDPANVETNKRLKWPISTNWDEANGFTGIEGGPYYISVMSISGYTIPLNYTLYDMKESFSFEKFFDDEMSKTYPSSGAVTMYEFNPAGLGAGLNNPVTMLGSSKDPTTGMIIARQRNKSGEPEWIARYQDFLSVDWSARLDNISTINIDGVAIKTYPLVPQTAKVSMGTQQLMCNHGFSGTPTNANALKLRYERFLGADSGTNLAGDVNGNPDGLFAAEVETTMELGVLTVKPRVVFNMQSVIDKYILPWLVTKGFGPTDNVKWSVIPCFNRAGVEFQTVLVSRRDPGDGTRAVWVSPVIIQLKKTGPTQSVNGYLYYSDPTVTIYPSYDKAVFSYNCVEDAHWKMNGTAPIGMGFSSPTGGSGPADITTVMIKSLHRYPLSGDTLQVSLLLDIRNDFTVARWNTAAQSSHPIDSGVRFIPRSVVGMAVRKELMSGAGVVITPYVGVLYDQILTSTPGNAEFNLATSNILVSQYVIYFNAINNVILGGRSYNIDATYIDLRDIDSNPANKTFYVYLTYKAGQVIYEVSRTIRPESPTNSMIAIAVCGTTQIDNITPYNRFSVDSAIISDSRQGSAILASRGSIIDIGSTSNIFDPATDLVP